MIHPKPSLSRRGNQSCHPTAIRRCLSLIWRGSKKRGRVQCPIHDRKRFLYGKVFHVKHLYEKGTVLLYHTPVGKNRRQKEFSHGKIMIFREELPKKQEPRQKSSPACLFLNIFSQKSALSLPEIGRSDCFFSSRDLTGKFNIPS